MAAERILVVTEVFEYSERVGAPDDARIIIDGDTVVIQPHDAYDKVRLTFSREDWEAVHNFVCWVWSPPTVGGRD